MENVSFEAFSRVNILAGKITHAEEFPKARKPAYKIWVDFGDELGVKKTSAQVTAHYKPEDIIGRKVMGCVNLGTRNIAGFVSEFLLLGFADDEDEIILPTIPNEVKNGQKLH